MRLVTYRITLFSLTLLLACTSAGPPSEVHPQVPTVPNRLAPLARAPRSVEEPVIKVGLLSDQSSVTFDRIEGGYVFITEKGPSLLRRGFTVSAPLAGQSTVRYAVQVALLTDLASTEAYAERLRRETSSRIDVVLDPVSGYRILAGDFESSEAAQPFREQLISGGVPKDIFIVRRPAAGKFKKVHNIIDDENDQYAFEGESLLVIPASKETITIGGQPYRGAARIFINNRGLFNVINELNLEDYVRGVVPNEMGPRVYDELEALKAQALAARTYGVKRMGDFALEGYDICPTPACQVYRGFSSEDAMSDQAVGETAGLIITHGGQPIDALYTSTCGGETSDVGVMFPGRNEAYLHRTRCVELDLREMSGRSNSSILSQMQVDSAIFAVAAQLPAGSAMTTSDVVAATSAAARIIGTSLSPADPPRSLQRGEVLRYFGQAWDLSEKAEVVTLAEDRKYYFPRAGDESSALMAAAFLIKYRIVPAQHVDGLNMQESTSRDELYALLYSWLQEHEAISETAGKIFAVDGRTVTLKTAGKKSSLTLPSAFPLYRKIIDRYQEQRTLPYMFGDRASVISVRGRGVTALVVEANYDGASFDRTSSFANWTRSYRATDLVTTISNRNPVKTLEGLRILGSDPSHRVTELEVAADGKTFVLRGLPIRWSLNVPDNLFVLSTSMDPDGVTRYTFFGKGWGHGVGMCQVGAYGMAFRGWTAERIVKHFYTDVEIVRYAGK